MENYFKPSGYHISGVPGELGDVGYYIDQMRQHDLPVILQSVDHAGIIWEAQETYHDHDVLVFRMTSKEDENLDRLEETPDGTYIGIPEDVAEHRFSRIQHFWPIELDRSKVWSVYINEPSKESKNYDFLGRFELRNMQLALVYGYKHLCFGWSLGTPERDFWQNEYVLECLQLMAQHPDQLGLSLHEYSGDENTLLYAEGYHVGRFENIHDVCDENNIAYPTTIFGEFGAGENAWKVPNTIEELDYIQEKYYGKYPNVKGAMLWTIGKWGGSVVNDVLTLIKPITDHAVAYEGEEIEPPIPPIDPEPPIEPIPPPDDALEARVTVLEANVEQLEKDVQDLAKVIYAHENRIAVLENYHDVDPVPPPMDADPMIVIDVSGWNNYNISDYDIGGAIIRTSNGLMTSSDSQSLDEHGVDRYLDMHLQNLNGKPFGLYHFVNKDYGAEQIDHFMEIVEEVEKIHGKAELGLWLDFEETSPEDEEAILANCLRLLELAPDHHVGIYTRSGWWNSRTNECYDQFNIWCANWTSNNPISVPPPTDWKFSTPKQWLKNNANVWQFTSKGGSIVGCPSDNLDVNWFYPGWLDLSDCEDVDPIPPPVGDAIDMLPYYDTPSGSAYAPITIVKNNWGANDERHQNQKHNGKLYVTKNKHIEKRQLGFNDNGDQVLFFTLDDSPNNVEYYTINSPDGWLPRYFRVGASFIRRESVTWFNKSDCSPTGATSNYNTTIKFIAKYDQWTSEYGITFNDVIHLQWLVGGHPEENYYLAPYLGYVGWEKLDGGGHKSSVSELITNQGNNTFDGTCYHPSFGEEYPNLLTRVKSMLKLNT